MLKGIIVVNTARCIEGIDHKVIPRDNERRSLVLNETDSVCAVCPGINGRSEHRGKRRMQNVHVLQPEP